jgi:hypothetical protein
MSGRAGSSPRSDPTLRAQLYEELGINCVYDPDRHTMHVQAELGRRIGRVGGATPTFGIPTADRDAGAVSSGDSGGDLRYRAAGAGCQAPPCALSPSLRRPSTRF